MPKPVVLVIENSIGVTGALKSVIFVAEKLRPYFTFIFVISTKSATRSFIEQNQFCVVAELPMLELSKRTKSVLLYGPQLIFNSFRLRKIVKVNDVQIIHNNDLYNLLPVALKLFGNPISYICHVRFLPDNFPRLLYNFWIKLHLYFASQVICVSKKVLDSIPKNKKSIVIHDAIPMLNNALLPREERGYQYFLYLANYINGKGQQYALEAFYRIHNELPTWRLRFVGGDMGLQRNKDFKFRLKQLAEQWQIERKIEWGEFTHSVQNEYKNADIVLNFSESESFSITCLEALCMGKALIATDSGGPSEIIDHMKTGMLVTNRDVNEMTQAMRTLASSEELRKRFSEDAGATVFKKFSLDASAQKLKEVYDTLVTA